MTADEQLADLSIKVETLIESVNMLAGVVQRAMADVVDVASLRHEVINLRQRVALLEAREGTAAE